MDGPVAYLGALRRFAAEKIEGNSTSPRRIPLAVRRPDLDRLVIDEQSTYRPIPMLDLVNDVLIQGIDGYQQRKGDARPVHELLAEKKHPFVFPYHFAHQQVSLALTGEKPGLGELNHALTMTATRCAQQPVAQDNALALLSQLSPSQQRLLIQPSPFAALSRTLGVATWYSPIQSNTSLWTNSSTHFEVPVQASVIGVAHENTYTLIELRLEQGDQSKTVKVRAHSLREGFGAPAPLGQPWPEHHHGVCLRLDYHPADNGDAALDGEYHGRLLIDVMVETHGLVSIGRRLSVDVCTANVEDHSRTLTEEEAGFMREHYGIEQSSFGRSTLSNVKTLCAQAGLDADQLQALICQKDALPRLSPNCPIVNPAGSNIAVRRMPNAMNYGAVYNNGTGGQDSYKPGANTEQYNNALTLVQVAGASAPMLGNTSLNRFDRLQRMIRLQRWTGLPFAELDTLIAAAMRAEGDANPALEPNQNTLRMLGAYRYFNREYGIGAEELAAFVHELTPFASGDNTPLLDRVFNTPVLFGTRLRLDNEAFAASGGGADAQKTVNQLCAGLGLEPGGNDFILAATATQTHVGPLKRSLAIVSSLYRQARVARLFGIGVSDCHYLLECLGGSAYVGKIATGMLAPRMPGTPAEIDTLDILMQLDALVRFLKTHKLRVIDLRGLLEERPAKPASQASLERLQQLATDTQQLVITPAKLAALGLPASSQDASIDWFLKLRQAKLLSQSGVLEAAPLTVKDSAQSWIVTEVACVVASLDLPEEAVAVTAEKLGAFVLDHYLNQQRLAEGFVQQMTGLLPERALMVSQWANVTWQGLLVVVNEAWPAEGASQPVYIEFALDLVEKIQRRARAIEWAGTGTRALRTFAAMPQWLGVAQIHPLTLGTLRLLKAYDTLFNTLGQPEERLLDYLEQANTAVSKRPGKRQLAVQAHTCNAGLASLLGWSESEVAVLTAQLPQHTAKTVAHIDWVRRAQALALETGLNATSLLQACALNADSLEADWQAVGQAAMAAAQA